MLVTSLLPIQTTKVFYSFFYVHLCPPLWRMFRHPWPLLKTLYNMRQFSKSCPKKYYVFCPVTSLRRQSRLYLREWDRGRKERTFVLRKFYNSKPTAVTEPEVLKNAKQYFFMPAPSKKAKKMPYYNVHAKHHFFHAKPLQKAKFLEFGLKNANLATLALQSAGHSHQTQLICSFRLIICHCEVLCQLWHHSWVLIAPAVHMALICCM